MTARGKRGNRGDGITILLAPCGFKESLTVTQLVDCMARGVSAACHGAEILRAPMVDGGEGFTAALVELTGGQLRPSGVTGPVGQDLVANVGLLGGAHQGTAAIEIAAAAGLRHVPPGQRNPLKTTSYGVGELIRAALDFGAKRLLVGCGDSGTNDGGAGLAQALGIGLYDARGRSLARGGGALDRLARIDMSGRDRRIDGITVEVAVNWNNMLLGQRGVARVYGPQKGASPAAVKQLECGLRNLAAIVRRDLGVDVRRVAGAGASGGLGAGLHAFLGARLFPRYDVITRFLDFDALLARADLVVTGEGRLDELTAFGKLPAEIAGRARLRGVPVVAVVGSISDGGARAAHALGIDAYFSILDRPTSLAEAMARAPELVAKATEQVVRLALLKCPAHKIRCPPRRSRVAITR